LHPDVFKTDLLKVLAPTNDDIWFWLMAVRNKTKIKVIEGCIPDLTYVEDTQEEPALCAINDRGEKLFWRDFYSMLEYYPDIEPMLRCEYELMREVDTIPQKEKAYDYQSLDINDYVRSLVLCHSSL
jgi:hypothetical protein